MNPKESANYRAERYSIIGHKKTFYQSKDIHPSKISDQAPICSLNCQAERSWLARTILDASLPLKPVSW